MIPRKRGFTILELMVALALLVAIIVIAVPNIVGQMPTYRLRRAAKDLTTNMQLARLKAISTGRYFYIDFAIGSLTPANRFYTIYLDEDGSGNSGNSNGLDEFSLGQIALPDNLGGYRGILLPSGVQFGASGPSSGPGGSTIPSDGVSFQWGWDKVRFSPTGIGTPGAVYLRNDKDENYAITVAITGRVKLWRWNGSNWQ